MWNFNIDEAPKGTHGVRTVEGKEGKDKTFKTFVPDFIISASSCGKVIKTSWLPDVGRWEFYTKETPPVAWMPWPKHPSNM